ncbi:MAG: hypothetical protein JO251_13790 [Verrucomicrobia bacterium]|nr:hypothetical protein [Verrucomicrobiota bacterium]
MLLTRQQILRVVLNRTPLASNGSDSAIAIVIKIFIRRESAGKIGGKPIRTKTRHVLSSLRFTHTWPGEHELRRQTKTMSECCENTEAFIEELCVKLLNVAGPQASKNKAQDRSRNLCEVPKGSIRGSGLVV